MKHCISILFIITCAAIYCRAQTANDSILLSTKRYVTYIDNQSAKSRIYNKTYVLRTGHTKYSPVINNIWPDSIETTVNVVNLKGEQAVYTEIPQLPGDLYQETSYYYRKNKLVAVKFIFINYASGCVPNLGMLQMRSWNYYDSTGHIIKTEYSTTDNNNRPIETEKCMPGMMPVIHQYNTFSQTPFALTGVEGR